ncbi:MAG: molybdopterin molybdotransferase MoeA [Gemmatimonadetes bacterium]|nr:molybdopterin molybdotransferase MoeA [Gemmatimonadota bacterium]
MPPARSEPARHRQADWISAAEAERRILERVAPLGTEEVALLDALGRVLAEDVTSNVAHPGWDNSAMDGYAVRSADIRGASRERPVPLRVVEDVPAGAFPTRPVGPGEAIKVMTGSPIPEGADGVTRLELTRPGAEPGTILVVSDADAARNIRQKGEDVQPGQVVARARTRLRPAEIAVLASVGAARVRVYRRPRVGVLSTGDELADFDAFEEVRAGRKIMNSNSYALGALLIEAGCISALLGIARDTRESTLEHLERGLDCDALITTAGVAVGERDYVKDVLEEMGFRPDFWRVRIRPGSPLTFGLLRGRPVFALPGNPVSAMVTFEVFVRPALDGMQGVADPRRPRIPVRPAEPIRVKPGLTHFLRCRLESHSDGVPRARLTGPQGSGILSSMSAADALLVVPEDVEVLEPTDLAKAIPLRSPR